MQGSKTIRVIATVVIVAATLYFGMTFLLGRVHVPLPH